MWIDTGEDVFAVSASQKPAARTLANMMTVDLMVNERGNVWLLHDKELPMILNWVEYDATMQSLVLVGQDGETLDLGMVIHKPLQKPLSLAKEIYIILMNRTEIKDMYILPLMVRNSL